MCRIGWAGFCWHTQQPASVWAQAAGWGSCPRLGIHAGQALSLGPCQGLRLAQQSCLSRSTQAVNIQESANLPANDTCSVGFSWLETECFRGWIQKYVLVKRFNSHSELVQVLKLSTFWRILLHQSLGERSVDGRCCHQKVEVSAGLLGAVLKVCEGIGLVWTKPENSDTSQPSKNHKCYSETTWSV